MSTSSRVLLVTVAVLGVCLWVGSKGFIPPTEPTPADEFTISGPFTHGNLSVFLLHGPDAERSRPVLGLDEALARKCAVVHETGEVNELAVENTSEEDDLLLLSGDIVKGGKQDRVLQATMILPPKSGKVPVRSFCVEQSRWTKRGREDATQFGGNDSSIAGVELKKAIRLAGSQGEVWHNVAAQQAALSQNVGTVVNSKESPTSLQLALENEKVKTEVAKFREGITKQVGEQSGVVGFVTVVNGNVTGAEAFGSQTLFKKAWAKAVNAAAVEAVAEKPSRPFGVPTAAGVRTFLANASREQQPTEPTTREALLQRGSPQLGLFGDAAITLNHARLMENNIQIQAPALPSPDPSNPFVQMGGRVVTGWNPSGGGFGVNASVPFDAPRPASGNTVVEYREKSNGAVIHKSFLPR